MATYGPLSDWQVEVLQWIADDSPAGRWDAGDYRYKTTAYGLSNRRLVTVDRRRHEWKATITDAGRHYLAHGDYPDGLFDHVLVDRTTATPRESGQEDREPAPPRPRRTTAPARLKPVAKSDQLVADVVAAGGRLEVETESGGTSYDSLVQIAIRRGAVPDGKLLKIRSEGWRKRVITLEEPPEWMTTELEPIPIGEQLRSPHEVVKRVRDSDRHLPMRRAVRGRALRLLQALVTAAVERGYTVRATDRPGGYIHPSNRDRSVIRISVFGHDFGVEVVEVNDRVPHEPTQHELRRAERDSWFRVPTHDEVPSGKLRLKVERGLAYRQSVWTDSGAPASEMHLAQLLQEIELRAHAFEQRRLEREREEEKRRRERQAAMERANEQLQETHRATVLKGQVDAWELARRLDPFLAEMSAAIAVMLDPAERAEASRWLEWARQYAQAIDPLNSAIAMPDPVEASAENLKPFLGGHDFYGATYGY